MKFEEAYEIEGIYNIIYVPESVFHYFIQDFIHYFIQDFIHYFIQDFIQDFIHNHMHFLANWSFTTFTSILATVNAQNYWSAHKFWGPGYIIPTTLFGHHTGRISIVGIRVIPIKPVFMWRAVVKCGISIGVDLAWISQTRLLISVVNIEVEF